MHFGGVNTDEPHPFAGDEEKRISVNNSFDLGGLRLKYRMIRIESELFNSLETKTRGCYPDFALG